MMNMNLSELKPEGWFCMLGVGSTKLFSFLKIGWYIEILLTLGRDVSQKDSFAS
jgi:hypothetical protein